MAIDYNRIRLSGTITGGEIWSTATAFQTDFGTGPVKAYEDLLDWCVALAALNTNKVVPASFQGMLSSAAALTTVRAEYIDSGGVVAQVAEVVLGSPVIGGSAPNKPPQVSAVMSLLTGRPGRSYRGRQYWPLMYLAAMNGVQVQDTAAQQWATDWATFLAAAGDAAGTDFAMKPAVFSGTLGTTDLVQTVAVDTVMDTQRRRRNSLRGNRFTAPVA